MHSWSDARFASLETGTSQVSNGAAGIRLAAVGCRLRGAVMRKILQYTTLSVRCRSPYCVVFHDHLD